MLYPQSLITITQRPTTDFPRRDKVITFDFVNKWDYSDSWQESTSKGSIVLPKKINAVDRYGKPFPLFGTNKNVGGFSTVNVPLILRGDTVKIEFCYYYWDKNLNIVKPSLITIMEGFIANVKSGQPIELEIENNMWKLKQLPCGIYNHKISLEQNMVNFLSGTGFKVNMLTSTKITFDVGKLVANLNETVAQFLARLKKDYALESYFRGNELRVGSLVYIEAEARERVFEFQDNIMDDPELEYQRKNDVVLSAVASNTVEDKTGTFCKDGTAKTKRKRLEVFVTIRNGKEIVKVLSAGEKAPENTEGERMTFKFPWCNTTADLAKEALDTLRKGYYDGFKGSFKTFGTPHTRHGDNVQLIDNELPERNGRYKVKGVDYSGGVDGFRQEIKLHYKIDL